MNEELRRLARDLAANLVRSFQATRLYPEHHPERARRTSELLAVWNRIAGLVPEATLDIRQARLDLGRELSLRLDAEPYRDLLADARDIGLQRLTLQGLAGGEVLIDLFRRLTHAGQDRAGHPAPARPVQAQSTPLPEKPANAATRAEPIAAPADRAASAVSPAAGTQRTEDDPAIAQLRAVWEGIAYHRQLDGELLGELVRGVARRPGDGLLEPVDLLRTTDSRSQILAHALNVARLVYVAARSFAPGARSTQALVEAALLADVGMLAVPPAITSRGDRLSPQEFRIVRQHPSLGARWLLATPLVGELAAVVAFEHHLRCDGQGYPQTGRTWRVMPASQLYQIADVYAALRTDRPYRPRLSEQEARALLTRLAARWLDEPTLELLLSAAVPAGIEPAAREPQPA